MKMFLTLVRRPSQGANLSELIEMITSKERHTPGTFQQESLFVKPSMWHFPFFGYQFWVRNPEVPPVSTMTAYIFFTILGIPFFTFTFRQKTGFCDYVFLVVADKFLMAEETFQA